MQRLYEDNISCKIRDERFAKLSETYEAEQKQLIARIAELEAFFAKDQEQAVNLKTFTQHVKRYINLDYLDAEVLCTFIKRIVVTDNMPSKKGKGIEVKLEYTIDEEYKTCPDQQDRKTTWPTNRLCRILKIGSIINVGVRRKTPDPIVV